MKFPAWVHAKNGRSAPCPTTIASRRLRYIILLAAANHDESGAVGTLAKKVGMNRANLYLYISRGAFPLKTAERIENALGRESVRKEHLVFPLQIAASE